MAAVERARTAPQSPQEIVIDLTTPPPSPGAATQEPDPAPPETQPHVAPSQALAFLSGAYPDVPDHLVLASLEANENDEAAAASWLDQLVKGNTLFENLSDAFPTSEKAEVKQAIEQAGGDFHASYAILLENHPSLWEESEDNHPAPPGTMELDTREEPEFANITAAGKAWENRWWTGLIRNRRYTLGDNEESWDKWLEVAPALCSNGPTSMRFRHYVADLALHLEDPARFNKAYSTLTSLHRFKSLEESGVADPAVAKSLLKEGLAASTTAAWMVKQAVPGSEEYRAMCKTLLEFPRKAAELWSSRNKALRTWHQSMVQTAIGAARASPVSGSDTKDTYRHLLPKRKKKSKKRRGDDDSP